MIRSVVWLRQRPVACGSFILGWGLATMPTHDLLNELLLTLRSRLGPASYSALMSGLTVTGLLLLAALVARRIRERPARSRLIGYWLGLFGASLVAIWLLVALMSESVHFLQYGVVALPLWALTGRALDTFVLGTWLGALDEGIQYWILHRNWGTYYDFNDVVLDGLGLTFGILAVLTFGHPEADRPPPAPWPSRTRRLVRPVSLLALGALITLVATGRLTTEPGSSQAWATLSRIAPPDSFWVHPGWSWKAHHVLRPAVAIAILAGMAILAARLDRVAYRTQVVSNKEPDS